MKKASFLSLCLCPYGYIAIIGLLFALSGRIPALDDDTLVFSVLGVFLLLPGIFSLWYLLSNRNCSPEAAALKNLHLKLWNLPALALSIGILACSVISANRAAADGAQEGGLAVFLWGLLLLPIFVHSFCLLWTTAISAIRISAVSEKRLSPVLILLHWVPVAAFVAALRVSRGFRQSECRKQ